MAAPERRWQVPYWTQHLGSVNGVIRGSGEDEWPDAGLTMLVAVLLFLLCMGERPLSVRCFLCFFLSTRDGEQRWEEHGARGALCMVVKVLSVDSEGLSSEADLRATSIRKAFSRMSLSFLMRDLMSLQIWHFSLM